MTSRRLRLGIGIALAFACSTAAPAAAQTVALEGCLVTKKNVLCSDPTGDDAMQWTDHRSAAFSSEEAYFQYHGVGPWTIDYPDGTISCPAATTCEQFIPEILVPQYSQIIVGQSSNGSVFAGALSTRPED